MEIKRVETYSLFEFCQVIQENILNGWRFDFESNENAPIAFGSMLVTGMVKAEDKISVPSQLIIEETPEINTQDNQVKRGRKPKQ
jgi:hypothetical protein